MSKIKNHRLTGCGQYCSSNIEHIGTRNETGGRQKVVMSFPNGSEIYPRVYQAENISIGGNDCDFLRVVLFCKGPGADKDSYRPRSDEKQWWGRRDALARCVSSFLFGGKPFEGQKTKKELVLFFDEDRSRLHMTVVDDNSMTMNAFPKEETLIKLWKQAAQNLHKEVSYKGLKCIIHVDPTLSFAPKSTKASSSTSKSSSIEKIDTKREVLEYIQKHCSLDFLRKNRINSHPDVVLRKTNRKALLKIWDTWTKQRQTTSDAQSGKGSDDDESSHSNRQLKTIFGELLQFPEEKIYGSSDSKTVSKEKNQIIAGTLHESSEEFPCFRFRSEEINEQSSRRTSYRVCLFLGAVRDMTSNENKVLGEICRASKVPFVGVRFGKVPEFTSKILSLLAFHHANRILGIAMKRLLDAMDAKKDQSHSTINDQEEQSQSTCLNVVCTVPKSSKEISIQMEDRDQIHWKLVRVIVCSLWRSKLVSSKSKIHHTNSLRLVFEDGVVVALDEREFVEKLASKHQAAPSEFQILTALIDEIDRQSKAQEPPPASSKAAKEWSRKKLAKRVVKSVLHTSPIAVTCTMGIEATATDELVSRFYDHAASMTSKANPKPDQSVLMIIDIADLSKDYRPSKRLEPDGAEEKPPREIYKQLLSASRKLGIPTIQQNIVPNTNDCLCWDWEAASIVAIQHMCYQNRVFARGCCLSSESDESSPPSGSKKRKKPS